jgi:hypothetical protein
MLVSVACLAIGQCLIACDMLWSPVGFEETLEELISHLYFNILLALESCCGHIKVKDDEGCSRV